MISLCDRVTTFLHRLLDRTSLQIRDRSSTPGFADTQPAAPALSTPREYNRREIVLPSGRFASMSPIFVCDLIRVQSLEGLPLIAVLCSFCVAIDDEPLTIERVMAMEAAEFSPISAMVSEEGQKANAWKKA